MPRSEVKKNFKLPNRLSTWLKWCLNDLAKIERTPGYKVYMGLWHFPSETEDGNDVCCVCLAGSAMACRGGAGPDLDLSPPAFSEAQCNALHAADRLRTGELAAAVNRFYFGGGDFGAACNLLTTKGLKHDARVPSYESNPEKWRAAMWAIYEMLKEAGL